MKELILDTETTGLDPMQHGIFMIGGIVRIDNEIKEAFELYCDVFIEDQFSDQAMSKHNHTPEEIHQFPDPYETYQQFIAILQKYVDKYDNKFLRSWFESNGDQNFGSWFWHPWIDVMSIAAHHLRYERHKLTNFQLVTVAEHLGIKVINHKAHGALYDAEMTLQVYDHCQPHISKAEDGSIQYRLDKESESPGLRKRRT